ncbi:hypothetical protein JW859_10970 [bacterium]|nr:hypothetical protein [bacterium]
MDMAVPVGGGGGQLTVAGAQTRLADLAVGQLYRVEVTDVLPGKVEFLLGNQYLLAATPFRFRTGDVINLRLIERTADLLTFQLTLPPAGEGEQPDVTALLRAARLPDTADNRVALTVLLRAGITVNNRTLGEVAQLIANLPAESVAAFLPLYRELVAKGLILAPEILEQLARQSGQAPELSGTLAAAFERMQKRGARDKKRLLDEAVAGALTSLESDRDLPTAQALKDKLRLLYGSPEKALYEALLAAAEDDTPVEAEEDEAPAQAVDLTDLANIALGEEVPAELAVALNMLQALRIESLFTPNGDELRLPVVLDGEPTEVGISVSLLAEQYYQKDYALRVRVENATQGKVEFQLRTRGPGLYVDVLAAAEETLAVYRDGLAEFTDSLNAGTPFFVRRIDAKRGSL